MGPMIQKEMKYENQCVIHLSVCFVSARGRSDER